MASENKLHIDAQRGERAKSLLSNELLTESFEKIERLLMDDWKTTDPEDSRRREDAWRSLKLLHNLQEQLKRVAITGEASSKELLKIKSQSLLKKVLK